MANADVKKTILLVDDDETHLLIAQSMLKHDYQTIVAKSGQTALNLVSGKIPDLILLDILMPNMDGWETYQRLKSLSVLKDVPIAFLTSENDLGEEKRAYKMGAADYIMKPYDKTDLLKRIEKILRNTGNSHKLDV